VEHESFRLWQSKHISRRKKWSVSPARSRRLSHSRSSLSAHNRVRSTNNSYLTFHSANCSRLFVRARELGRVTQLKAQSTTAPTTRLNCPSAAIPAPHLTIFRGRSEFLRSSRSQQMRLPPLAGTGKIEARDHKRHDCWRGLTSSDRLFETGTDGL
jgi:hypothetical protein